MKGEPELMLEMLSSSQPSVAFLADGAEEGGAVEMQILRHAEAEAVGHVEGRRAFFGMRIERILREPGWNGAVDPVPPTTWLVSSMDLLQV